MDLRSLRRALSLVVRHHVGSPPALADPAAYARRLAARVTTVCRSLSAPGAGVDGARIARITGTLRRWMWERASLLARRVEEGRIVDGHGDLRPEHVCLTDEPAVIDCLEFDPELRELDGIDDLGYLALESEALGAPDVARRVVDTWRSDARDDAPEDLLAFHQAVAAVRRGGVAALRLSRAAPERAPVLIGRLSRYLALAEDRLGRLDSVSLR